MSTISIAKCVQLYKTISPQGQKCYTYHNDYHTSHYHFCRH
jgi:hypothetical protein